MNFNMQYMLKKRKIKREDKEDINKTGSNAPYFEFFNSRRF